MFNEQAKKWSIVAMASGSVSVIGFVIGVLASLLSKQSILLVPTAISAAFFFVLAIIFSLIAVTINIKEHFVRQPLNNSSIITDSVMITGEDE